MSRPSHESKDTCAGPLTPISESTADDGRWSGAVWVGQIALSELRDDVWRPLSDGIGFRRARLLIWDHDQPLGSVEVPVAGGAIDLGRVRREAMGLAGLPPQPAAGLQPPISVMVCTRDRPEHLRKMLASLDSLDYPEFEVVVVDNNPASGLTPPVVAASAGPMIRLVDAAAPGLSVARNVGLREARYDIVAFTDDDVVLDHRWLSNIAVGFARDSQVACVCGMVPTSELLTPAQEYFDRRVSWAHRWSPAVYSLRGDLDNEAAGRAADPLFPLRVSTFGTGANFAVRRDVVVSLGGFDECLGAGAPAGSGEDVDVFLRILLAGHLLVREPSAVVWHSHRETVADLEDQMYGYTLGLSAWMFKLLVQPRTFAMVVSRLLVGLRHLRRITNVEQQESLPPDPELNAVGRRELTAVARGPWALMRGRLTGRSATPLKSKTRLGRLFDVAAGPSAGKPARLPAGYLAAGAVALSLIGTLGALPELPVALAVLVVGAYVLGGPGSLVLSFYPDLPGYALAALVPVVGAAVCILTVTGLLTAGFYRPTTVLLIMTLGTVVGGMLRCAFIASSAREPA